MVRRARQVSPEGGLTAFEWTIPQGALVPWGYNEVYDSDRETLALEIALLGEPLVDTWGLVFFEEGNNGLEAGSGYLSIGAEATLYSATMEQSIDPETRSTDFFSLGDDVEEGQLLRGVVVARGPAPAEAAIAFRILDHDPYAPGSKDEPAETPSSFIAARKGAAPIALPVRLETTGFALHGYFDLLLGGLTPAEPMWGIELSIGQPEYSWSVGPRMRALGGAHSFVGSVTSTMSHGFDLVGADYFSIAHGRTAYAADIIIHDEPYSASGADVEIGLAGMIAGVPSAGGGAFGLGDGDGETSGALAVDRVLVGAMFAVTEIALFELGADIEDLFGKPAMSDADARDLGSLVPSTLLTPRGLTRIAPGGAQWTYTLPGYEALQKI